MSYISTTPLHDAMCTIEPSHTALAELLMHADALEIWQAIRVALFAHEAKLEFAAEDMAQDVGKAVVAAAIAAMRARV